MSRPHLDLLNEEQLRAATHRGTPLRIIAGAGTGKTRTLTSRFIDLVHSEEARIEEILALTFTQKAAAEMRDRILAGLDRSYASLWISTFHSFCQRALRLELPKLGLSQPNVIEDDERLLTLKVALEGYTPRSYANDRQELYRQALLFIDRVKDECLSPVDALRLAEQRGNQQLAELAEVYRRYQIQLRKNQEFDFGELQLRFIELLEAVPDIRAEWQRRFKHILVDEYQDVNRAQARIIELLAGDGRNLTVVGDIDQAIYAFRGASHEHLDALPDAFKNTTTIILQENYRSHQAILNTANALISHNRREDGSRSWLKAVEEQTGPKPVVIEAGTELEEAQAIAREIARLHWIEQVEAQNIAVLLRSVTVAGGAIAQAIRDYDIPVTFIGRDYEATRAIADVLATLRLVDSDHPEALCHVLASYDVDPLQIINARSRDGSLDPERLRDWITHDLNAYRAVRQIRNQVDQLRDKGLPDQVYGALTVCNRLPPPDEPVHRDIAYMRAFSRVLERTTRYAKRAGEREDFLALLEQAVTGEVHEVGDEGSAVQVMTVHAAKGLEFDYVFVAGLADGRFPLIRRLDRGLDLTDPASWRIEDAEVSDGEKRRAFLEEERRLGYVALTRARKRLYLSYARGYEQMELARSTFIDDITSHSPDTIDFLDRSAGRAAGEDWSAREYARAQREILHRSLEAPELAGEAIGDLMLSQWTLRQLPDAAPWIAPVPPVAMDGNESLRLSYTALMAWENCPRQYYFGNILRLPDDQPAPQLSLGTAIHDTIQWMNEQRMAGTMPTEEQVIECFREKWMPDGFEAPAQEAQNRTRGERLLRRFYRWESKQDREIISTEETFDIPFGHHTLTGRIDCVARTADGTLEIIDYKSGRKSGTTKNDAIPQLAIYRMAWDELHPGDSPRTSLYFLRHNNDRGLDYVPEFTASTQSWALDLEPEQIDDIRDRLAACANGILNNEFTVTSDPGACARCPYTTICEGAKIDG